MRSYVHKYQMRLQEAEAEAEACANAVDEAPHDVQIATAFAIAVLTYNLARIDAGEGPGCK